MVDEDLMEKVRGMIVKNDMENERFVLRKKELIGEWNKKKYGMEFEKDVRMEMKYGMLVLDFLDNVKKVENVVVENVKVKKDRDEMVRKVEERIWNGIEVIGYEDRVEERLNLLEDECELNVLRLEVLRKNGCGYERLIKVRMYMKVVEDWLEIENVEYMECE